MFDPFPVFLSSPNSEPRLERHRYCPLQRYGYGAISSFCRRLSLRRAYQRRPVPPLFSHEKLSETEHLPVRPAGQSHPRRLSRLLPRNSPLLNTV